MPLHKKTPSGRFVWVGKVAHTSFVRDSWNDWGSVCCVCRQNNDFSVHLRLVQLFKITCHSAPFQPNGSLPPWKCVVACGTRKHTHAVVLSPGRAKTMASLCFSARTRAALRLREQLAAPSNIHERDGKTMKDNVDPGIQRERWRGRGGERQGV